MSKCTAIREYPQEILKEIEISGRSLIHIPHKQLRAAASDEALEFITELNNVREGHEYAAFEICKVSYDQKSHVLDLDADISFPKVCREITLYADLLDLDGHRVAASFAQETLSDVCKMEYKIEGKLEQMAAEAGADMEPEKHYAVLVRANWRTSGMTQHSAAILRPIGDGISYGIDVTYPKKETDHFVRFTRNGIRADSADTAPQQLPALFEKAGEETIQIALFREPQDTRNLDYLCEFGKDAKGQPYFGVPTFFSLWLDSSTISFCTEKQVTAVFSIASLDPAVGGKYVVAVGSSFQASENIKVDATEKEITIQLTQPWQTPFPYGGALKPYDFSYEVALELYTITEGQSQPVLQPRIVAISSLHKESCLNPIPHISIRWGCFKEGTRIQMGDGTSLAVEKIAIGDIIKGQEGNNEVCNVWKGNDDSYIQITMENGGTLCVTKDHPILTSDGWRRAEQLSCGMALQGEQDPIKITDIREIKETCCMYNLSLKDPDHTLLAEGIVAGDFDRQNQQCV